MPRSPLISRGFATASSAVVNLAYPREAIPRPLDGFGFVVPHVERRNIIACSYSSMKYAGRAPAGHALLRVFVGGALRSELTTLSDEETFAIVRAELRDLLGIEEDPLFQTVARYPESMPQYELGHLDRITRIEAHVAATLQTGDRRQRLPRRRDSGLHRQRRAGRRGPVLIHRSPGRRGRCVATRSPMFLETYGFAYPVHRGCHTAPLRRHVDATCTVSTLCLMCRWR